MKLFVALIALSCLSVVLSQLPTYIYSVSTVNGQDNYFNSVFIGSGISNKNLEMPSEIGNVFGVFNGSGTGFYVIGRNNSNINLYAYNTATNSANMLSYLNDNYYQFTMQPLGFDPTLDIVYLAGGNTANNNVSIFSWDFFNHNFTFIELPLLYNSNNIQSNGAYDPTTGNYFIAYLDTQSNIRIATYNIPASYLVSDNVISQFKSGTQTSYIEVFYASNQLYAVQILVGSSINLFEVNFKTGAANKVYSIKSPYYYYGSAFVNNENYVTFMTANTQSTVQYTTIELENYSQLYQTQNVSPIQQSYNLLLI